MSVSRWERGLVRPRQFEVQLAAVLFDGDLTRLYVEPETSEAA